MTIFLISPFQKIIEVIFLWLFKIIKDHGISLLLLSLSVNIILLPFYYLAERIEQKEKDIQEKMKPKIEEFKSVYKGYELHLYIKNVHRRNNYRPIYALRGLVSLLIQIPFFIGAYTFLSNYAGFAGISFIFIKDLADPDRLIRLGDYTINLLPFIMTLANLAAGYVYAKGKGITEKLTIVIVALFFLVILYKSPASLLVYWTCNNIFSLVKNLISRKYADKNKVIEGV